ncbi:phytanoyl-CoA dioxygenase family protein [Armatimonas sp.]|uniref:phytanoyl-CoA dioxygenase family protein n=1 Tax=Armatimonas sp. TaxID=1872638 RepID=UPI00286B2AA3|nr:phytanoyl-CoA dioxygenase family protein [Armatimonas sp.]
MSFITEGFLASIPVLSADEAAVVREQFNALEARVGRETAQIGLLDRHNEEPFIAALAVHPKVLEAVETVLGPDFFLLATHFFCKYGEGEAASKFVAWHQDVTYWGLEPATAVTVWLAIDDADEENGCMRVVPGSHAAGIREHTKAQQAGNLLSINQEVPVTEEEEASAVNLPLRAGFASLHDGCLIHGSLPNVSTRRRCGLTLRYVPTEVKQSTTNSHGKRWHPTLVRGIDRYRHWIEE